MLAFFCLAVAAGVALEQPTTADEQPGQKFALPDGTIRKGTLANAKLIHDAHDGAFVQAVLMGMAKPAKEEMFVVQEPVGNAGAKCWRERWFVTDEKAAVGSFDMFFLEDGQG